MKVVERAGKKLEDLLVRSNLWSGKDCERQGCLLCETKSKTEKNTSQSCSKRNSVYQTWCHTCQERDEARTKENMGEKEKIEGEAYEKIEVPLNTYIGETSRSVFERGTEHLADVRQLKTSSHILKHLVDMHEGEEDGSIDIRMKVLRFHRSAFERQIHESVKIQMSRNHNLLNSKSEYNRCALPRISLKVGEKDLKERKEEIEEELRKEEEIEEKIKNYKKQQKKIKKTWRQPCRKRIKLNKDQDDCQVVEIYIEKSENEERGGKRKKEEEHEQQSKKRRKKQTKMQEYLKKTENIETTIRACQMDGKLNEEIGVTTTKEKEN